MSSLGSDELNALRECSGRWSGRIKIAACLNRDGMVKRWWKVASIIPWARDAEDCGAGVVASAGDRVAPADLTSILAQGSEKGKGGGAGIKFESHRRAENKTAGGKRSRLDHGRVEAGRIEGDRSGDFRASYGAGAGALSDVACHAECLLCGVGEGAAQQVRDIGNAEAGDGSVVAAGASTGDAVGADEGGDVEGGVACVAGEGSGEGDDLSLNGRRGERCGVGGDGARQAKGGQSIEAL